MSSDHQFTATGPAAVGFQTHGTEIDRGAEIAGNTFGVLGTGPTGLVGQGDQDGVHGIGGLGRGGRFESANLRAQVKLEPQSMVIEDVTRPAEPAELVAASLPTVGDVGDLYMTTIPDGGTVPAALWLCIRAQQDNMPARWGQILLGNHIDGTLTPK